MSPYLNSLFTAWVASEQIASSVMFIAAILLFWTSFTRIWAETPVTRERIWRVFRLFASITLFLSLIWGFYFLLKNNNGAFNVVLDKLISNSPAALERAQTYNHWGSSFTQGELSVQHFIEVEVVDEIQQGQDKEGKEKPILYLKRKEQQLVPQESIVGLDGEVGIHVVDPAVASFECQAVYRYTVVNQSESPTIARFSFPFSRSRFYENLSIRVDGKPAQWRIEASDLLWDAKMDAQQRSIVEISYQSRGVDQYIYSVASQRVIQDFSLTVSVDSPQISSSLTPDSKSIQFTQEGIDQGYRLKWVIDRAILAPVVIVQVNKPRVTVLSKTISNLLDYAGRSLVLLLSLATLTLIICNARVDLTRMALLAAIFSAQFLALTAVYPFTAASWPILAFGLLTLFLCFFIFRRTEKFPRVLILGLTAIFCLFYPLAGFLPGEREKIALDGALQAGMILYVFVLTFYTRVKRRVVDDRS